MVDDALATDHMLPGSDPVLRYHLIECRDRYSEQNKKVDRLDEKVDSLRKLLWTLISAMFVLSGSVIAALLEHAIK